MGLFWHVLLQRHYMAQHYLVDLLGEASRTHNARVQLVHLYCILVDLALKATGLQALPEAPVVGSYHQDRLFAGMRFLNLDLHSRHFFTSGVSHTRTVEEALFSVLRRCRNPLYMFGFFITATM